MKALITSGGGAKGAFTIGAISELARNGIGHFDIISGTSTGSLMATFLAIGRLDDLKNIYTSLNNDDVLTRNNILSNITSGKPYFYGTQPLNAIIDKYITDEAYNEIMNSDTTLALTAVSLQTGEITSFTTKPLPSTDKYNTRLITSIDELKQAMKASSNQAAFLPPVKIDGEQFVDGGNREVIPSRIVIDQNPDEIYVMSNNPQGIVRGKDEYDSVIDTLLRAISIFVTDVRGNDVELLDNYRATGKKVVIIEPDRDLDPDNPTGLRFHQDLMVSWLRIGELTARKVIQNENLIA